jgi:hypothetical protein
MKVRRMLERVGEEVRRPGNRMPVTPRAAASRNGMTSVRDILIAASGN